MDHTGKPQETGYSSMNCRVAVVYFGALVNATLLSGPAIVRQLTQNFGYGAERIGTYFSVEFAGFVAAGLIGYWMMPRFDWRRVAQIFALLFAIGSALTIFVLDNFAALLMTRFAAATAGAIVNVVCIASSNEDSHPSRAFSFFIMGQLVAGAIGLAIFPRLFETFGLWTFFALVSGLTVVGLPMTNWFAKRNASAMNTMAKSQPEAVSAPFAVSLAIAVASLGAVLAFYVVVGGVWTFVGQLAERVGLDAKASGDILSVATVVGIAGVGTAALFRRGVNLRRPVFAGYAVLALSIICFTIGREFLWFAIGAMLFKFSWTFVIPFVFTAIGKLDSEGRTGANVNLAAGLGLAFGPQIAGSLVERQGMQFMLTSELAVVITSALLAGWIVSLTMRNVQAVPV